MDRYGRTQEGSQSDPSREWTGSRPETGLEEAVWHLGLGEGESGYPERPDEADCIYYLRTGVCGFGHRCRFNHPRDRGAVLGAARGGGEFPERIGQPVCQYYMRTGSCKFGASCKYHHPKQGGSSGAPVSLNYYGYPLRPGEKECTYYMKTGQCKFGMTCKFHHPQLTNLPVQAQSLAQQAAPVLAPLPPTALYPALQSHAMGLSQQYGVMVARPPMMQGSYVQSPYGHMLVSPGIVPYPSWNPYAAPVSPVTSPSTQPTVASAAMYGIAQLSPSAPAFTGAYQPMSASTGPSSSSQKENPFPERPGQPECQHYLKTGDCKYGSSCRYHHPPELMTSKTYVALSPMSLPLRPGVTICSHYAQHGHCKYGPQCKYDHPMGTLSDSPSASSLADMPVAPYPVGSSLGTLAPSSSSSELRPELISGASKESSSTRMASLMSSSSGSVGLVSSKTEKIPPQSSSQRRDQSSAPSSTSAEARTSS